MGRPRWPRLAQLMDLAEEDVKMRATEFRVDGSHTVVV
jgi:hypothetical protein